VFSFYPALNLSCEIFLILCTFFYKTLLMHFLYKSSVSFSFVVYFENVFQMNIIFTAEYIYTHAHTLAHWLACSLTLPTAVYEP
jgi:hypothetical protein